MGQTTTIYCDRCKKNLSPLFKSSVYSYLRKRKILKIRQDKVVCGTNWEYEQLLCKECTEEFEKFMRMEIRDESR